MKSKKTKSSRNLLISMLWGDGTISNNNVFKLSHCEQQRDYLEWKLKQLETEGLRHNGVHEYTSKCGYNKGKTVVYSQLSTTPFIKALRRIVYRPNDSRYVKTYERKLLNRMDAKGIAIWYMDDGCINHRKYKDGRCAGFYIRIATCTTKEQCQIIIDYFKEVWDVNFYTIKEGPGYSLCCGTKEGKKFIDIVKPYVEQVPSMLHKITYSLYKD